MKSTVLSEFETQSVCDALILLLPEFEWENNSLFRALDEKCQGSLRSEAVECQFVAKPFQLVGISTSNALPYRRIFLVGLGSAENLANFEFKRCGALCARAAAKYGLKSIRFDWREKSLEAATPVTIARIKRV